MSAYGDKPRKLDISVDVNHKELEQVIKRNAELEQKLNDANSKLRIVAEQKFKEKLEKYDAPDYITNPQELKSWIDETNAQPVKNHGDPVGKGGTGNIPLSFNQNLDKNQDSYESHEELVFDVMDKASRGDKEAQAVKAKLQEKFLRAIKSGDMPTVLYDENQLPEDKLKTEPSILKKILERENNRIRRKALERRGEL